MDYEITLGSAGAVAVHVSTLIRGPSKLGSVDIAMTACAFNTIDIDHHVRGILKINAKNFKFALGDRAAAGSSARAAHSYSRS